MPNPIAREPHPSICVLYGFCEGPGVAKNFLKTLTGAGYQLTNRYLEADIIVAHSGGCFLIPENSPARIIMVGLAYWPGKSMLRALSEKIWKDFHSHHSDHIISAWLQKSFWNFIYFWNMPHNFRMLAGRKQGSFWQTENVTLVRNEEDSSCTPDMASLPFAHTLKLIELPGQHDDIWLHPKRYIEIIKLVAAHRKRL